MAVSVGRVCVCVVSVSSTITGSLIVLVGGFFFETYVHSFQVFEAFVCGVLCVRIIVMYV